MKLGYVSIQGRGETDRFLAEVAAALQEAGLRLAGTVQTNTERANRRKCDMDLIVLPDGPTIRISEDRGALARGCILDSEALEQTVVQVAQRLDGADLLIVNKFGKRESEGKGLAPVIAEALHRDMPVLVGVNGLNLAAFLAFAGEEIEGLATCPDIVTDWCLAAIVKQIA